MAKTAAKSAKAPAKTTPAKSKAKATTVVTIDKVSAEVLATLESIGVDQQLQSDIKWCLGSYQSDNNPVGLFEMAERALAVFKAEKEKKTKGVPAKLIGDLEKVLKSR